MSSQTKFQAMSTLDSILYARYTKGGPTPQVQNLSWTIVFLMKQVPHQISELDMQTSHHPHKHGLWPHEGAVVIVRKVLMMFSTKTRSVGPLGLGQSPAFKGGSPDVAHVPLC